jgi:glycosyltransferase involved in cell wall biosynthesis
MTQQLLETPTIESIPDTTLAVSEARARKPIRAVEPAQPPRIRILHIISDLSVAGAEIKLYKVLAACDRTRFDPAVISMRNQGDLRELIEAMEIPVFNLGIRGSLPSPLAVARLARIARRFNPELIHGWMYHGNLAAQFAGGVMRQKPGVLWSIHQSLYSFDYEKFLTTRIIKLGARWSHLPDKVIYNSNTSARQHEAIGYQPDQRVVLGYGFDTNLFAPSDEARRSVRAELGLSEDALLIGLAGRYHPAKDHSNFLRAAALLKNQHQNVRFVLCGLGVDGNNVKLTRLVRELGLNERTFLLGERRDIPRIIASLDIAASSSSTEGFPNVIGEAMSSGVPCVVTAVSDLPQVIGDTGRAVPPQNAEALAEGLREMIRLGAEQRQQLGAAARQRIIDQFSLNAAVAQYEKTYTNVLAARSGNANC